MVRDGPSGLLTMRLRPVYGLILSLSEDDGFHGQWAGVYAGDELKNHIHLYKRNAK
jgi:hypothetical protein